MTYLRSMPYLCVSVIVALLMVSPKEATAQSSDVKLWTGFTGKVDLLRRAQLNVEQQQRLGADIGFEKGITDFELRLAATDFLRVGASYRTIATYDDGYWHRGSLNLGLGHDLGPFGLSYQLRLQSTVRSTETVSVIRNKFGLQYDSGGTITPAASFELHYSTTNSEIREVRLRLGADKKLSKRLAVDVSYMLQSEFNTQVNETNHVLRVGLVYVFRRVKKHRKTDVAGTGQTDV